MSRGLSTIFHQGAGFSNSSYWTQSASAHGATSSVSSMHGRSPRGVLCRRWSFKGLISARKHHWAKKWRINAPTIHSIQTRASMRQQISRVQIPTKKYFKTYFKTYDEVSSGSSKTRRIYSLKNIARHRSLPNLTSRLGFLNCSTQKNAKIEFLGEQDSGKFQSL